MCWEYEKEYEKCFDHVWQMYVHDGVVDILEWAGVKFNNKDKCKKEFFELLSSWHEKRLIDPEEKLK